LTLFLRNNIVLFDKVQSKIRVCRFTLGKKKKASAFADKRIIDSYCDYVAKAYSHNIRMINAVAESRGIKSFFILQPCLAVDKPLTEHEKKLLESEAINNPSFNFIK